MISQAFEAFDLSLKTHTRAQMHRNSLKFQHYAVFIPFCNTTF